MEDWINNVKNASEVAYVGIKNFDQLVLFVMVQIYIKRIEIHNIQDVEPMDTVNMIVSALIVLLISSRMIQE